MNFGRQVHYCPNCGARLWDSRLGDRTKATMCSYDCIHEWEYKYAGMVLGKDSDPPETYETFRGYETRKTPQT